MWNTAVHQNGCPISSAVRISENKNQLNLNTILFENKKTTPNPNSILSLNSPQMHEALLNKQNAL